MRKFDDQFNLESTTKYMSEFTLVDYDTVRDKTTDVIYPLSKLSSRYLYRNIGMRTRQFSKLLYDVDRATWRDLVAKKMSNPKALAYLSGNKAIIVGGEIVNITNDTSVLAKFITNMSSLYEGFKDVQYEYISETKVLSVLGLREDNQGLLSRFYLQEDYIELHECFLDSSNLLNISPFKVVNSQVNSEEVDLVLNKESILSGLELSASDPSRESSYNEKLCYPMSVDELSSYTKKYLKYKLGSDKDFDPTYIIENNDLSYDTARKLEILAQRINNSPDSVINTYYSNYLKKSITMTDVTFGVLADAVWGMVQDEYLEIEVLIQLFSDIIRQNCHYSYIHN